MQSAALFGLGNEIGNHLITIRVDKVEPIVAWPESLARMDDTVAVVVVNEEISVLAIIQRGQYVPYAFLGPLIIGSGIVINISDRRKRQIGEVQEFGLLCFEQVALKRVDTALGERGRLPCRECRDQRD